MAMYGSTPPPGGNDARVFFFPWAIYRCVTANTKVIKIQPIFPKEAFGTKNPIAFPNICGPGGYSHTLPIRVCAAQQGRDFEAPDLERGIHFRGVF